MKKEQDQAEDPDQGHPRERGQVVLGIRSSSRSRIRRRRNVRNWNVRGYRGHVLAILGIRNRNRNRIRWCRNIRNWNRDRRQETRLASTTPTCTSHLYSAGTGCGPYQSSADVWDEGIYIYILLTKLVRSRWLDIGRVLFLRFHGPRLRLGP